jgi:penicillin-binding protein 2
MGRVIQGLGVTEPKVGDTLVTSIDAKVQSVVEHQLEGAIMTARKTVDPVTGRKYAADSGSAIVLNATNGRLVAMASYPTYNPDVWVGGITQQLGR